MKYRQMRKFFLNLLIILLMEAQAEAQNACFQARCQFSPGNYFVAARAVSSQIISAFLIMEVPPSPSQTSEHSRWKVPNSEPSCGELRFFWIRSLQLIFCLVIFQGFYLKENSLFPFLATSLPGTFTYGEPNISPEVEMFLSYIWSNLKSKWPSFFIHLQFTKSATYL